MNLTPEDIIAENEAQELRQLTRVLDAVAAVLPDAHVAVWLETRAQRTPSIGTCHVIQYAGEINDSMPVRGATLEIVRNKLVRLAAEIREMRGGNDQASELRRQMWERAGAELHAMKERAPLAG